MVIPKNRKTDKWRLKEKRGLGRGINYIPWLKTHEVPSNGRKHRVLGVKHKRTYHFLSDLEYYFYLLQLYDERVVEIREQFPLLSLQTTRLIAKELNIRHPSMYGEDRVMTTDFLLTVKKDRIYKDIVRTIKPSNKINNRTLEKFKLEEEFFKRKYEDDNFDWGVITENEINKTKALNISNLIDCYNWNICNEVKDDRLKSRIYFFKNTLLKYKYDVEAAIINFSEYYKYSKNDSKNFFKFLVIRKEIEVNLEEKLIKDFRYIKINI
ncbi:MAG: heteromeric transposase endonuclease subunit TnsA [Firmicutes bacterium]|nr:heteromeric transposase endonuclease subunit TnsA [Bacillota bacterium]